MRQPCRPASGLGADTVRPPADRVPAHCPGPEAATGDRPGTAPTGNHRGPHRPGEGAPRTPRAEPPPRATVGDPVPVQPPSTERTHGQRGAPARCHPKTSAPPQGLRGVYPGTELGDGTRGGRSRTGPVPLARQGHPPGSRTHSVPLAYPAGERTRPRPTDDHGPRGPRPHEPRVAACASGLDAESAHDASPSAVSRPSGRREVREDTGHSRARGHPPKGHGPAEGTQLPVARRQSGVEWSPAADGPVLLT